MKERPILFSGEMVRAILDGRKTQTRRVVKCQPRYWDKNLRLEDGWFVADFNEQFSSHGIYQVKSRYGVSGNGLWVQENWGTHLLYDAIKPTKLPERHELKDGIWYLADVFREEKSTWMGKTRPGRFMPRRFSRILLEIVSVRVERLQDISEEDAKAEGWSLDSCKILAGGDNPDSGLEFSMAVCKKSWFKNLWESINGPGSWEANPWVWVIEFKRVTI